MKLFKKRQTETPSRRRDSPRLDRASEDDLERRYTFRRNRTLTGSLSSDVESTKLHHVELRSARVQGHDLKSYRRKLFGVLLGIMSCIVLLGYLIFQSIAAPLVAVDATTLPVDQATRYQRIIKEYLRAHPLQQLRSTVDTAQLTNYLQEQQAPEVAAVSPKIAYAGFGKSTFTLVLRRPVVMWHTGNRTFYVDETGTAFEQNYFAAPTVQVVDKTGIQTQGNQVLASNRLLGFIGKIIGRMQTEGFTVTQVALPENTTQQVQVSLEGVAYPIKFSVDRPAGEQGEDAARAVRHLGSKGITPAYLDVRASGKAYYQ